MLNLMWLFTLPFIFAIILFTLQGISHKTLKYIAIVAGLVPLLLLMLGRNQWIGAEVFHSWLPALSINFHLGIDSLSLVFLYLTAIIIPISIATINPDRISAPHIFYGLILLLEGLLIGFFSAKDLVMFTIFWEAMLFPLYFIISFWGGSHRHAAAIKFLIYLLAGSSLMIAAVLALYLGSMASTESGTFNLAHLATIASSVPYAKWICLIFLIAFAVKTPLFPFHAWLPDAYYQAPTAGTILLSAILSKAGIYGIIRIGLGFFPDLLAAWSPILLPFAIVGVLYGGLAAWMQSDFKRLIAYSSFSHVNFVLAGLFIANKVAHEGAILQAFNHGITIAGLFLVAGWLKNRIGTTAIGEAKGVAQFFPILCWTTLLFVLSSVALPGTNNFIGELFILFGLFKTSPWQTFFLGLTVILSVIYMLRWMQKVYFETPELKEEGYKDIGKKEMLIALPLILLILWIGIYPAPILQLIEPATEQLSTKLREE